MKAYKGVLILVVYTMIMGACTVENKRINQEDPLVLLTSHSWQLIEEKGLDLPKESLPSNVIHLKEDGKIVYYEDSEKSKEFIVNRWKLSEDKTKVIEILPDDSKVESEIVVLDKDMLKWKYKESDGLGGENLVVETYRRYKQQQ